MKLTAGALWLACVAVAVGQGDTGAGRVAAAALGLCALGATLNVWQNR